MSDHLSPWQLMKCKPGVCQECARDHPPELPHDQPSLYYQYRFYAREGRWPTWDDAAAHCTPEVRELWMKALAIETARREGDEEL